MTKDEEFYPRSARLDFKLNSSKKVEELSLYQELHEETSIYIETGK